MRLWRLRRAPGAAVGGRGAAPGQRAAARRAGRRLVLILAPLLFISSINTITTITSITTTANTITTLITITVISTITITSRTETRMRDSEGDEWGLALVGSLQKVNVFDGGTFWVLPLTCCLSFQKCQGVHFSPICQN